MKRLLAILLALLLVIPVLGEEDLLISHAMELARELDEIASDSESVRQRTDDEAVLAVINKFAKGDHTKPVQIIQVDLSDMLPENDPFFAQFGFNSEEDIAAIRGLSAFYFPLTIASYYGEVQKSASNLLMIQNTYPELAVSEIGMYILLYKAAAPVAVVWSPEEEGAHLTARSLPDADDLLNGFKVPLTVVYESTQNMDETDERSIAQ